MNELRIIFGCSSERLFDSREKLLQLLTIFLPDGLHLVLLHNLEYDQKTCQDRILYVEARSLKEIIIVFIYSW